MNKAKKNKKKKQKENTTNINVFYGTMSILGLLDILKMSE